MQNTNIVQGSFTSTGVDTILMVPMGIDWIEVWNDSGWTSAGTTSPITPLKFYWQKGFSDGTAYVTYKENGDVAVDADFVSAGGFTIIDTSGAREGTPTSESANVALSAASPRVVTVTVGGNLYANMLGKDIVRFTSVTAAQGALLSGIDFSFDTLVAGGGSPTFNLTQTAIGSNTGTLAAASAVFTPLKWNPVWYPSIRYIYYMVSSGSNTRVYTTVRPFYQLGQSVRFNIPRGRPGTTNTWGMSQINGLIGNVVNVASTAPYYFDVDIDSSGFTAFNAPGTASMAFTVIGQQWATVIPVGDVAAQIVDTSNNPIPTNIFNQAVMNQGYIGVLLPADATVTAGAMTGPAGESEDVIYWKIGKSFSNQVGLDPVPPVPPLGI